MERAELTFDVFLQGAEMIQQQLRIKEADRWSKDICKLKFYSFGAEFPEVDCAQFLWACEKWLQSLPAAHRQIVMEEAKKAGASALKANVDQAGEIFDEIRKRGVRVSEVDKTPFRDAVKPIYAELGLTAAIDEARKAIGQ